MADMNWHGCFYGDSPDPAACFSTIEAAIRYKHYLGYDKVEVRPVRLRLLSPLHDIHAEDHDPQERP